MDYPSLKQINEASPKQIYDWYWDLIPNESDEFERICERFDGFNLDEL